MNRRQFLLSASSTALSVQKILGAEPSRYKIGYTTNTRGLIGGWQGDPFVGFREAREVGFHWVEAFATALSGFYPDNAAALRKRIDEIGVNFVAITGGSAAATPILKIPRDVRRSSRTIWESFASARGSALIIRRPIWEAGGPEAPAWKT